ncbi:hypothetical protein DFQ30_001549, partial [Apophysomyces sp. BC1015]
MQVPVFYSPQCAPRTRHSSRDSNRGLPREESMKVKLTPHLPLQLSALALAGALLAGCQTQQGNNNTALGTGVGAATGAGLGAIFGGGKGAAIGAAAGAALGGITGYNWQAIKNKLSGATAGTGAQVSEQPDGSLKVNIPSSISFDTNSYAIKPSFTPVLDQVSQTLAQHPELIAQVVGHTDNTGQPQYNQTLSQERSQSVAQYLTKHGVAAQRLAAEGRGQSQPIADNSTQAGRAQNRRVEIYLRATSQPRGTTVLAAGATPLRHARHRAVGLVPQPRTDPCHRGPPAKIDVPSRFPSTVESNALSAMSVPVSVGAPRRILVTSALPYANGPIHIGHLVEYIQTDIWVRTMRMHDHDVVYVGADDTHGTPIMLRAQSEGITPQQLIERVWQEHKRDFDHFSISFDNYYSTDSDENRVLSEKIFAALNDAGLIAARDIEQAYDPVKAMFLPDRFIKGE